MCRWLRGFQAEMLGLEARGWTCALRRAPQPLVAAVVRATAVRDPPTRAVPVTDSHTVAAQQATGTATTTVLCVRT